MTLFIGLLALLAIVCFIIFLVIAIKKDEGNGSGFWWHLGFALVATIWLVGVLVSSASTIHAQ